MVTKTLQNSLEYIPPVPYGVPCHNACLLMAQPAASLRTTLALCRQRTPSLDEQRYYYVKPRTKAEYLLEQNAD